MFVHRWRLNRDNTTYDHEAFVRDKGWEVIGSLELGSKMRECKCGGDVLDAGNLAWGVCFKCGAEMRL